jgi:hypothetical protein
MSHRDTHMAIPRSLAAVLGNGGTKGKTDKVEVVARGGDEASYMTLTFCLDLYRRLLYVAKAARPLREYLTAEQAREIRKDNEAIDAGKNWRERAKVTQEIMFRLHDELSKDWGRALEEAAAEEPVHAHH